MLVVSRSIHIDAPVARVFALIADPAARARLDPGVTPLRVEIEGDEALRQGSVVHFRLQIGGRIADYRAEVREFVPNRRIVSLAQAGVPFEVRLETEAENGGTRLTQTESFEPHAQMLESAVPDKGLGALLGPLRPILLLLYPDYAARLRQEQEERLAQQLGERMARWLEAIKRHLEAREGTDVAH